MMWLRTWYVQGSSLLFLRSLLFGLALAYVFLQILSFGLYVFL